MERGRGRGISRGRGSQQRQNADISAGASNRVVNTQPYPNYTEILTAVKNNGTKLGEIQVKLNTLEQKLQVFVQNSFDLTKMPYYPLLLEQMAKIYCEDITRQISSSKMQAVITRCLRNDAQVKLIFDSAMHKFKEKMNYYRAEERRKIIGVNPYESYKDKSTPELAECIMHSIKAPLSVRIKFTQYVALARTYVRSLERCNEFSWSNFRNWVNRLYPVEDDILWDEIMADDEYYYSTTRSNDVIDPWPANQQFQHGEEFEPATSSGESRVLPIESED